MMIRKIEQTWAGHGKKDCLEAIKQAHRYICSNEPDKFYDAKYTVRSMHCSVMDYDMVSWFSDRCHGKLCDFIDKLCNQIDKMNEYDYYYISVRFMRGHWF